MQPVFYSGEAKRTGQKLAGLINTPRNRFVGRPESSGMTDTKLLKELYGQPSARALLSKYEPRPHKIDYVVQSTYHYLSHNLSYDPVLQRKFNNFANRKTSRDKPWHELMEEFAEQYDYECNAVNTYDEEFCMLDETLQFVAFQLDGKHKVLLQMHYGSDIRAGYTRPMAFHNNDFELFPDGMNKVLFSCGCKSGWIRQGDIEHWSTNDMGCEIDEEGYPDTWECKNVEAGIVCTECNEAPVFETWVN